MKFVAPTQPIRGLLFDIDNTLYRNDRFAEQQITDLIHRLGEERGISAREAEDLVAATRAEITRRDGTRPSLGNTFVELGIPIETSVVWRTELVMPEAHLSADAQLRSILQSLTGRLRCAALTNNPATVGRRTLAVLGVDDLLPVVIGLDLSGRSKPDWRPFELAIEAIGCTVEQVLMIGDRWEVDCAPVVARGGGAALVDESTSLEAIAEAIHDAVDNASGSHSQR